MPERPFGVAAGYQSGRVASTAILGTLKLPCLTCLNYPGSLRAKNALTICANNESIHDQVAVLNRSHVTVTFPPMEA